MLVTCLVTSALLAASPNTPPLTDPNLRTEYLEAREKAGRDPDANLRLALWCEAHGLSSERLTHLAYTILANPSNATARGLLGYVAYRGRWKLPNDIAAEAKSDAKLQATLAEYNRRREEMPNTADAHWPLGLWCEQAGLKAEATAHFTAVTRLSPNHADAWQKLGCRKVDGRWLSDSQIAAEQAEADAQRGADTAWSARLKTWWKDWLANEDERPGLEAALADELEPRAVPTIRTLFSKGSADQQLVAVRLLDTIDSREAAAELARLAASAAHSGEVRREATWAIARRDPDEVIEPLVALMRTPMGVNVAPGPGGNAIAQLRVEDEHAVLQKTYVQNRVRVQAPGLLNFSFLSPILAPRSSRTAAQQLAKDLRTVQARNAARSSVNNQARIVLSEIVGQDLGPQPESWRRWLSERKGYAYEPNTTPKTLITRVSQHNQVQFASTGFHHNCFAKGTPVRTLMGVAPIETLRVGDQVLSEDSASGALSYEPIVVVYHNPPSPTLRIRLDREEIVATPIHRFWRVGKGWTLARDLKPGDNLRVLGGLVSVSSIESDVVQPVFNLELAGHHSFFVGERGALVHDNSRVQPAAGVANALPAPAATASDARPLTATSPRPEPAAARGPRRPAGGAP